MASSCMGQCLHSSDYYEQEQWQYSSDVCVPLVVHWCMHVSLIVPIRSRALSTVSYSIVLITQLAMLLLLYLILLSM